MEKKLESGVIVVSPEVPVGPIAPVEPVITDCGASCTCSNHWGHCVHYGLSKEA